MKRSKMRRQVATVCSNRWPAYSKPVVKRQSAYNNKRSQPHTAVDVRILL